MSARLLSRAVTSMGMSGWPWLRLPKGIHGIPGPEPDIGRPDDERVAIAVDRERVGCVAGSVEDDLMELQGLIQVGCLDEADAIVAILARAGQVEIHIGGIANLAGTIAQIHRELESITQQYSAAARWQAGLGTGVGEQAVETLHGFPAEGQRLIDKAAAHLQIPISSLVAGAGIVAGGSHICPGPLGQGTDQGLA